MKSVPFQLVPNVAKTTKKESFAVARPVKYRFTTAIGGMAVVVETTLGDITVELFLQERPRACLNFLKLCKLKYYNYNLFHTIEHGFIAQTGDPSGVGDGGESVWGVVESTHKRFFEGECRPKILHSTPGLLSMVSVGKNMLGSQFFFTLGSDLSSLDGIHCVIGEVTEGQEVLRKLNESIVDDKFRPYQDIRITHTVILEDPFDDPRAFRVPSRSPSPSAERLKNGRIGADEDLDDTDGKTAEEIQEMFADREAKARATILEIVGDLPDADCAPPENVLFVCKLNPVTNDDDLEILFSRFGKVKGCEVIRDKVSGDSLQYAFVEFEEQKACESAFFNMDNVLIDDRRIHVDFSQSVAKVKWRGKGKGIENLDGKNGRLDFNNLKGRGEKRGRSPAVSRTESSKRRVSRSPQRRRSRPRSPQQRRPRSPQRSRNRTPQRVRRTRSPEQRRRNEYDRSYQRETSRDRNRIQSSRDRSNGKPVYKRNDRDVERSQRRDRSRSPRDFRQRPARSPVVEQRSGKRRNDIEDENKTSKKKSSKKTKKSKRETSSSGDSSSESSSSEEERKRKKKKSKKKKKKSSKRSSSSSD